MKKTFLLLILMVGGLKAQTQTRSAPDCTINFSFTSAVPGTALNNIPQVASGNSTGGCVYWSVKADTFNTGIGTIVFQSNPTSTTTGTAAPISGWVTFSPLSGFTSLGTNPTSTFPSDYETAGNAPWVRVNCTAYTSGTIRGSIMGWRKLSASSSGGGGSSFYQTFQNNGSSLTQRPTANFKGTVTCVDNAGTSTTDCTGAGVTQAYTTVQNNGVSVAQENKLNFLSGTTCVDNAGAGSTDCTSSGGGGGGVSSGGVATYSSGAVVTLPVAGTTFFPPGGGGAPNSTEANVQGASPAVTISKFYVQLSANIGGGNTITLTFRNAGADQSVTCTISGASNSCNDTTHSFTTAAGDLLSIKAVTTGTVIITPEVVILFSTTTTSASGVTSGTFASLPAAGTVGRMFLFTDSLYTFALDNGSAWTYFSQGHSMTPPSGFAWQNQSTATLTTTFGGEMILSAIGAGGANISGRFIAYPATPFTRTVAVSVKPLVVNGSTNPTNANGGLYISDGTAVETFSIYGLSTMQIQFGPSVTNITTNITAFPYYTGLLNPVVWLRMDDGVTAANKRTFFYSWDGSNFTQIFQESNTANLTPTRIGYYANAFETGTQCQTWAIGFQ